MESIQQFASSLDDIKVLLLFYWVESCFIAYTGLSLIGIRIKLGKVIPVGVIHGVMVYLVRGLYKYFEIPFGTHTLILLIIMACLLTIFVRVRFGTAVTASLLGMVLLLLGEMVTMPFFYKAMNMPVEQIWANPWTHILAGYVGDSLIMLAALFTTLTGYSLIRLGDR
ncbi:hypothetical protein [Thermincola potens]|uniref:Uncharacterized protein n=1 Tax=Thermincola potens (strain JR) TaxID=635013 RepID=D5XC37_THEPJ|nr:hypothetical protein [Thermincola potens]ADG83489.1 hypothetical protein TherJR_2654 [Thermincola potens JR]